MTFKILKQASAAVLSILVCMTLMNFSAIAATTEFIAVNQDTNGVGQLVLSTIDEKGDGYSQFLESSDGSKGGGAFTVNISSDGTCTVFVPSFMTGNGIFSSDGNILSVIYIDDDYSLLSVAIKKASGMSNANLNGEYITVAQTTQSNGMRIRLTFNGKGGGSYQFLENTDGELLSGSLTYTVSSDGSLTFNIPDNTAHGLVSHDGKIATIFFIHDGISELGVMIQKSSGMSNADLKGQYIAVSQAADIDDKENSGSRFILTFDGNGNGSYQQLESTDGDGDLISGTFTYHVNSDGTFTFTSADPTKGRGIINTDGEIGVLSFIEKPVDDVTLIVFVKKSTRISSPSALVAAAKSSTQITLGWKDNSDNETGFKIERKTGNCSSTNSWTQIATRSKNETTYTVSGLSPDTTYSFRIRAYNGSSNSAYSNCASSKTGVTGTPPAPANLKATSASTSKINLSWSDNSSNETGFKIYRKAGTVKWMFLTNTGANVKKFTDTTAADNSSTTTYQYYIVSYNAAGNSPATYTTVVPYQPASLTAQQGTTAKTIKLTWKDKSANESGFEIYRKSGNCSSTAPWAKVATLGANKTSWTNSGLTSGTTYSYKIRAYKKTGSIVPAYGYSMWTSSVSAPAAP
ncbi:MAG: fibronectin type III domain-containing protein [Desulfobacterales bacterium]|nr:fibronectin type III domain-containing protein [Desulfobacterales bacterium]